MWKKNKKVQISFSKECMVTLAYTDSKVRTILYDIINGTTGKYCPVPSIYINKLTCRVLMVLLEA